jgi:hypothetical protein
VSASRLWQGCCPHLSLNLSGNHVWPLYSICESGWQAIISLHHQPSCQNMSTTYHQSINIMVNKTTQIAHSLTQSGVQGFHRCLCILQVKNPAHSNKLSQYHPSTSSSKTSCCLSEHTIIKHKCITIRKVQITCEQVSSKNKFCKCARAGCYTIELGGKTILIKIEVINVALDYNILFGHRYMYAMKAVASYVF